MERELFVVEDVFDLSGRGCVLVPGIPSDAPLAIKVHDHIRLARPDGSTLQTFVAGIELIGATRCEPHPIPILLPPELRKSDVPVGTKVVVTSELSSE